MFFVNINVLETWIGTVWQHELLWHQLTPLCVPMYSNWPQQRKNAEAGLFRQTYCMFVGLSRLMPCARDDRTESRSHYDWLRAGASELWIYFKRHLRESPKQNPCDISSLCIRETPMHKFYRGGRSSGATLSWEWAKWASHMGRAIWAIQIIRYIMVCSCHIWYGDRLYQG